MHTHTHTSHYSSSVSRLYIPSRPPLHLPPGPPGSHGDMWSEVSGWGVWAAGRNPQPVPCTPRAHEHPPTRAHTHTHTPPTHTQFTTLARLLINSACLPVNLQASIQPPFFFSSCFHHPSLLVLPTCLAHSLPSFFLCYILHFSSYILPATMPVMAEEEYPVWGWEGMWGG